MDDSRDEVAYTPEFTQRLSVKSLMIKAACFARALSRHSRERGNPDSKPGSENDPPLPLMNRGLDMEVEMSFFLK